MADQLFAQYTHRRCPRVGITRCRVDGGFFSPHPGFATPLSLPTLTPPFGHPSPAERERGQGVRAAQRERGEGGKGEYRGVTR